ncbi:MAG: HAD family hydrolase [Synergistaceae bacterium]|nr:HAD family hydrolase [Synergistaceae bacterium]
MKLIFLDIDGTLTRPGENDPPESAAEAIKKARARGNKVFLCTGRNPDMLKPLLKYGFDGVVSCSGGYVAVGEGENEEVLFDCPMTDEQRDIALESLHRNGVFCTIEAKDGSWGDENLADFLKEQPEGNSEIERWRKTLAANLGLRPLSEYDGSPIYKVVVMCLKPSQLDEARSLLEADFNFVIQELKDRGGIINGELINRKFDKGRGVDLIRERFGASREDTVGFGDSMNDLEMMRTVGTSVCMANGAEALKALADLVCPSVSEAGLARAFEELNLI